MFLRDLVAVAEHFGNERGGSFEPFRGNVMVLDLALVTLSNKLAELPQAWPWETAWTALFDRVSDPPLHRAA